MDPRESRPLEYEKLKSCRARLSAPSTDEELQRAMLEMLQRHNIRAVATGPLEQGTKWRAAAPDRIIPAAPFDDDGDGAGGCLAHPATAVARTSSAAVPRRQAGEFESDGYLSTQTHRLLHTNRGEDAALGWFTQQWRGHRLIKSTGSNGYWYAVVAAQPEKRVAIAVASNAAPDAGATLAVGELVSALLRATLLGECIS